MIKNQEMEIKSINVAFRIGQRLKKIRVKLTIKML